MNSIVILGHEKSILLFDTEEECKFYDNFLWTYKKISFLPHGVIGTQYCEKQPLLLSTSSFLSKMVMGTDINEVMGDVVPKPLKDSVSLIVNNPTVMVTVKTSCFEFITSLIGKKTSISKIVVCLPYVNGSSDENLFKNRNPQEVIVSNQSVLNLKNEAKKIIGCSKLSPEFENFWNKLYSICYWGDVDGNILRNLISSCNINIYHTVNKSYKCEVIQIL